MEERERLCAYTIILYNFVALIYASFSMLKCVYTIGLYKLYACEFLPAKKFICGSLMEFWISELLLTSADSLLPCSTTCRFLKNSEFSNFVWIVQIPFFQCHVSLPQDFRISEFYLNSGAFALFLPTPSSVSRL